MDSFLEFERRAMVAVDTFSKYTPEENEYFDLGIEFLDIRDMTMTVLKSHPALHEFATKVGDRVRAIRDGSPGAQIIITRKDSGDWQVSLETYQNCQVQEELSAVFEANKLQIVQLIRNFAIAGIRVYDVYGDTIII